MIRDEPILKEPLGALLPSASEWRCTVPGREVSQASREDPALRRGTYVRAKTPEEAASIFVSHEELRPYERIDVQLWKHRDGEPTTNAERADVIYIVAGRRCRPKPEPVS